MNRPRSSRPRTFRPTDLSPGPSQVGFEFLLWRHRRLDEKRNDEFLLAQAEEQLRLEREPQA
ncbi:MAG: hypothetical protein M3357_00490 [Actinomycetota bacterium]|nr:hypothetical protein [Actinomycetota bacterium]